MPVDLPSSRFQLVVFGCLLVCWGCSESRPLDRVTTPTIVTTSCSEIEDGGLVPQPDRDRAQQYFSQFAQIDSLEDERRLLTEFGGWLGANGYRVEIEKAGDGFRLSCPYFPPVTPWTDYTFRDPANLDLLPQ